MTLFSIRKLSFYLFILMTGLIFASQSHAQSKWYKVEMIVIEHPTSKAIWDENWPSNPGHPERDHVFALQNPEQFTQPELPVSLPDSELTLEDAKQRIVKRTGARVVFHQGWRQPLEDDQQWPVHLMGGKHYTQNNLYELDGVFTLSLSRYLHAKTDFLMHRALNNELMPFRIQEKHKITKKEVLYIDHPAYGILIKVSDDKSKA